MARHAEGWQLVRNGDGEPWHVRFSHGGRRYRLSTGARDQGEASREGAAVWAEVVHGVRRAQRVDPGAPALEDLITAWVIDLGPTHDPTTVKTCEVYAGGWLGYFRSLSGITREAAAAYTRERLKKVLRKTVLKELSSPRMFTRWCVEKRYLGEIPIIDAPPRRATGTVAHPERKRQAVELSPEEVAAILAELPEMSAGSPAGPPCPLRARYVVAYETALRPATLNALRAPDDYRRGAPSLVIRDEADKARFGREVPLSETARAALDAVTPEAGLIFGDRDLYKRALRDAAIAAAERGQLDPEKARKVTPYDLRHARLTHLAAVAGDNLPGLMFLAGHKQATTTSRYIRSGRTQADRVLAAAAASDLLGKPGFWSDSGPMIGPAQTREGVQPLGAKGGSRTPTSVTPLEPESRPTRMIFTGSA